MLTTLFAAATAGNEPAGGAAIGEVIGVTAAAMVVTGLLLWLGMGHRSGRVPVLGRLAKFSERTSGLPGWAALPAGLATGALLIAVFGMYWDISLHIGVGRDAGPLANPAHYFILFGLFGIFAAGFLAMVLPKGKATPTSIKLGPDWHAPLGGVLICACGAFSLTGFPLDDVWHRIFGQDVTLWGPTHLMLIGGAAMTLVGIAVLQVEGMRANAAAGRANAMKPWVKIAMAVALPGGFMLGLSTFQAEFDFGVPQFRFVFQPMMIMLAAGAGLVVARMWGGRGAALGAVGFFLLIRGALTVIIGPILGEPMPHFPLYVVEALIVEAVALRVGKDQPLELGLLSGLGIGTIGLAAEWGWSHVFMPTPWPATLFPEGAILGFACAVAGGLLGGWIGARLSVDPGARSRPLRLGAVLGASVLAVLVVFALYKPADEGVKASVQLADVRGGADREVSARITLEPRDAAEDAEWLNVTAWQGDGLVLDRLRKISEGVYETTEPIPVNGEWKALVRLHHGNSLTAIPIFLPADQALKAKEVPADPTFTRTFVADHEILQREQKSTSGALPPIAYGVVAAIALSLLALLAWGLHRLGLAGREAEPRWTRESDTTPQEGQLSAGTA
ncbi:MAG: hypothetical protein ACJ762_15170 [Solirubrobacteraceae bacterium]